MIPRRARSYVQRAPGALPPVECSIVHRVQPREVDFMGILWHGHHPALFEEAATEVRRIFGLGYLEFSASDLRAPIVQMHVDYHRPLRLDDEVRVTARLFWNEAARLDIEYEAWGPDGQLAASGYAVHMFTTGRTGEPLLLAPELLRRCWERWRARFSAPPA